MERGWLVSKLSTRSGRRCPVGEGAGEGRTLKSQWRAHHKLHGYLQHVLSALYVVRGLRSSTSANRVYRGPYNLRVARAVLREQKLEAFQTRPLCAHAVDVLGSDKIPCIASRPQTCPRTPRPFGFTRRTNSSACPLVRICQRTLDFCASELPSFYTRLLIAY